jgi:hypothetical protein
MLSDRHQDELVNGSGISLEVIDARGYRTVEEPSELTAIGFSREQSRYVPGLLIPIYGPDGSNGLHTYKPNLPREILSPKGSGKPPKTLKYELPKGCAVRIDCPSSCRHEMGNPKVTLWVTEGPKKADALASRGACAVDLLGVWNFKGKNSFGGITLLADFDHIALKDRDVRVVFDSDVMTKPEVRQALDRLTEHLQRKGAHVSAVYLPPDKGKKVGVDDFLLKHSIEELESCVEGPRTRPQAAPAVVRLLDHAPRRISRPIALVGNQSFVAVWPWVEVTVTETEDRQGAIIKLTTPQIRTERRLMIVTSEGKIYGDGGNDGSIADLGLEVSLAEIPPDRTWTVAGINRYRRGEHVAPADVFNRIADVVDQFIDFEKSLTDQRTMSEMVSCYILATWFLDAFNVIGFLWPNGEAGSGKTQLLSLVAQLGYLGQLILAGGSFASLRDLADYGATLCFDDAENLADPRKTDPDKRALLLAGNRRGCSVPVKEPGPDRTWTTRHVNAFCPRSFSAIRLPDATLGSRSIIVPLIKTIDRGRANSDPADTETWRHDRSQLIDDLWALALKHLPKLPGFEAKANREAELAGRDLEPWKAILAIAGWLESEGVEGLFAKMGRLSKDYQKERMDASPGDLRPLIIRAIARHLDCDVSDVRDVSDIKIGTTQLIKTSTICQSAKQIIEADELDIEADDVRLPRRLGRTLSKMRFSQRREGGSGNRGWIITAEELYRWARSLGLAKDVNSEVADTPHQTSQPSQTSQTSPFEDEFADLGPESWPENNWGGA